MKVLIAALGGQMSDLSTLDCALAVARRFDAHIVACHVRADPAAMIPLIGGEVSGALVADFLRIAEEEAEAQRKRAGETFTGWATSNGIARTNAPGEATGATAEWREVSGLSTETLAEIGRFSDLVVLARPTPNSAGVHEAAIEAALFGSGRPILLAPTTMGAALGEVVALAWNGSTESSRAVSAALPILKAAKRVVVVHVPTGDDGENGIDELVAYLGWNGVAAEKAAPGAATSDVGAALVAQAKAASADLLVMGGYGHSRLREMVFGGATRHMIDDGSLATLLVH